MVVNAVKIRPTGQETEWVDIGYAFLVSLEAKLGDSTQSGQRGVGEVLVAADLDGLTVIYRKNQRTYELKLNLLGDTPVVVQEDVTPPKKP